MDGADHGSAPEGLLEEREGACLYTLARRSGERQGTAVAITGAIAMIKDGLFDKFPCDELYGGWPEWVALGGWCALGLLLRH